MGRVKRSEKTRKGGRPSVLPFVVPLGTLLLWWWPSPIVRSHDPRRYLGLQISETPPHVRARCRCRGRRFGNHAMHSIPWVELVQAKVSLPNGVVVHAVSKHRKVKGW
ncbi:hypothetical protein B0T13DRAFT_463373 [Neurospora crassa]|nr:hypothetical protein B0T13DRAFT_463373 [Neurospora crassa]